MKLLVNMRHRLMYVPSATDSRQHIHCFDIYVIFVLIKTNRASQCVDKQMSVNVHIIIQLRTV